MDKEYTLARYNYETAKQSYNSSMGYSPIEEAKDVRTSKNKKRGRKERILALLLTLALASGVSASVVKSKLNKVAKILELDSISANSGIESVIDDNTIDGCWVELYSKLHLCGEVNKIANSYVSKTGNPFNNRMDNRAVTVDIDGISYVSNSFQGTGKIFLDGPDIIDPLKEADLSDYELTLEPSGTIYVDGEMRTTYSPILELKNNK